MTPLSAPLVHAHRSDLPVLLSVPHSGRDYPDWLIGSAAGGLPALTNLEDPLVDRLVWRAVQRGFGAVIARAPRAAIDCNRAEDEIDPAVVEGAPPGRMSARARGGLGIVPARTHQHGYLWRRPMTQGQLRGRIEQAHRPYHAAVAGQLAQMHARFGCALLLDCHSMPPPPRGIPPIVFGDGRGRSASSWVSREAMDAARRHGFAAGLNDPFAGGHVVERHGAPHGNIHALQLEISRQHYLDQSLRKPGPGFDATAAFIDALAVDLGEALLRRQIATAAE